MKKLALVLLVAVSLWSCNDDDGPNIAYDYAEITGSNLPDYFELGEEYDIEVTYELPNACHRFAGFNGNHGEDEDDETVYVYNIVANSSYDPNVTECQQDSTDLSETRMLFDDYRLPATFQYDTVRFRFLTGVSATDEGEYITVNVPIGAPDEDDSDDNTTTGSSN